MHSTVEILGLGRPAAWLPWAVTYFFLIGVSTASFFLALPGFVWRHPAWRGMSRQALLAALVCGLAAPVALLADLHQPGRFLNFYLHPQAGSWMAWGAFFIPLYLAGLLLFAWLCLRPQLAQMAQQGGRWAGLYGRLAYGGHEQPGAIRAAAGLAALGAGLVLLYTGMEVMVVQARSLWHTPILPLLFVVTAFIGALGMIALFEAVGGRCPVNTVLIHRWLPRAVQASLGLVALWLVSGLSGLSTPAADALAAMQGSFGWWMTGLWWLGSSLLLLWLLRAGPDALALPALLALHAAWLVRWIVFIGGQGLPKLGATRPAYFLTLSPDSLLGIVGMAGLCVAIYILLTGFIPWDDRAEA